MRRSLLLARMRRPFAAEAARAAGAGMAAAIAGGAGAGGRDKPGRNDAA